MPTKKHKGQQFERDVCKQLSLWVSKGKSKNLFWRSAQSGGRATTLRKKGEDLSVHAGDIAAIDPAGEQFCKTFFVECKFLKSLKLDTLVYPMKGVIQPIWEKCREQAAQYKKVPLLICKENGRLPLVMFDRADQCCARNYFGSCDAWLAYFDDLLETDPKTFIVDGESYASYYYSGPASYAASIRRL